MYPQTELDAVTKTEAGAVKRSISMSRAQLGAALAAAAKEGRTLSNYLAWLVERDTGAAPETGAVEQEEA